MSTSLRRTGRGGLAALAALTLAASAVASTQLATAAEPIHDRIVSDNPENITPNVEDGRVNVMVQIGNRIIAGGRFTTVTPAGGAFGDTQQHLRVQRHDRGDRQHLPAQCRHRRR